MGSSTRSTSALSPRFRIVVATTVALSFISFWRAGAIILNDLASSAFYAVGTAEQAFGKTAPWFILAVMLFAYAVRMVYIESCSMFTRGGVYRVVKEGLGPTVAKLSVSALLFDYVLTGPISVVSAGQYFIGLVNDSADYFHISHHLPRNGGAVAFAVLVTAYFWRKNVLGMRESSEKALRIMYVVTALVVIEIVWCGLTLAVRGGHLPPWPTVGNMSFTRESLGWLWGTWVPRVTIFGAIIAFGHSVLAMSGEESLAQVNREIEHPKLKNLQRTGLLIWVYSIAFTAVTAFLAFALVPDAEHGRYADNVISGLAMNVLGPLNARLMFQAFVVLVGALVLSGAANTAIVGSNGVLNRLAEDGVLTDWFRRPHPRYGTTYRMINLVVGLQLLTILLSRGDVYVLGEAYAFGVVWSFTLKTYAVLVLRFKDRRPREWRVPGNIKFGPYELPVGLFLIGSVLFMTAIMNLFTKRVATISGLIFTAFLFAVFEITERAIARRRTMQVGIEHFNIAAEEQATCETVHCRPGNVLVAVRDQNTLEQLDHVLRRTKTDEQDIVVMTTRLIRGADFAERLEGEQNVFSEYEQMLFTRVVSLAEKAGRPVSLTVVPGVNPEETIMVTAQRLRSATVAVGRSFVVSASEKARMIGLAWERLPHPRPRLTLEVISPNGDTARFLLGPHAPAVRPEDQELLHRIWLELTADPTMRQLHHDQLIAIALRRLAAQLRGPERETLRAEIRRMANTGNPAPPRGADR
jgi:amino acid transporter